MIALKTEPQTPREIEAYYRHVRRELDRLLATMAPKPRRRFYLDHDPAPDTKQALPLGWTDFKSVHITRNSTMAETLSWGAKRAFYEGILLHEVGHLIWTTSTDSAAWRIAWLTRYPHFGKSFWIGFEDGLEDARINWRVMEQWPGTPARSLRLLYSQMWDGIPDWDAHWDDSAWAHVWAISQALFSIAVFNRLKYPVLPNARVQAVIEECLPFVQKLRNAPTTAAKNQILDDDIMPRLLPWLDAAKQEIEAAMDELAERIVPLYGRLPEDVDSCDGSAGDSIESKRPNSSSAPAVSKRVSQSITSTEAAEAEADDAAGAAPPADNESNENAASTADSTDDNDSATGEETSTGASEGSNQDDSEESDAAGTDNEDSTGLQEDAEDTESSTAGSQSGNETDEVTSGSDDANEESDSEADDPDLPEATEDASAAGVGDDSEESAAETSDATAADAPDADSADGSETASANSEAADAEGEAPEESDADAMDPDPGDADADSEVDDTEGEAPEESDAGAMDPDPGDPGDNPAERDLMPRDEPISIEEPTTDPLDGREDGDELVLTEEEFDEIQTRLDDLVGDWITAGEAEADQEAEIELRHRKLDPTASGWKPDGLHRNISCRVVVPDVHPDWADVRKAEAAPMVRAFLRELKRLEASRDAHWETAQRRGQMDPRAVWKKTMGRSDYFRRRIVPDDQKDLAVLVLLDASGSIKFDPRRYKAQILAGIMMGTVLRDQQVPHAVVAFNTFNRSVQHNVLIGFDNWQSPTSVDRVASFVADDTNRDGYSIRWAADYLARQEASRSLLIVVSDGQPVYENGLADTALAVHETEQRGITVLGVSIGDDHHYVPDIYPRRICLNNPLGLPKALGKTIIQLIDSGLSS